MSIRILAFFCVFTGVVFTASGQTEKGAWLFGGNGNFNFFRAPGFVGNMRAYKQFNAAVSPTIGFFVGNNFIVGASIPLSITTTTDYYNSYSVGAGPFIRYYFGKGRIKVFPEAKVEFNRSVSKYNQPLTEFNNTSSSATYAVGPGIAYFMTSNIAIEGVVNFYTMAGPMIDRQGINFNIGLQFYLAKNR